MRRMTAMAIAAAFALFTANTFAQAKPDFSGKWTREAPAGGGAAAGGGGGGGARGGGGGGRGGGGGGGGFNLRRGLRQSRRPGNAMKIKRAQGDTTEIARLLNIAGERPAISRWAATRWTSKTPGEAGTAANSSSARPATWRARR